MAVRQGRRVVTTAGTRVQLSTSSIACKVLVISAETDNTNPVTVGGSGVVGALATREGTPLAATDPPLVLTAVEHGVDDLNQVWLDAVTNGEGVTFTYVENP